LLEEGLICCESRNDWKFTDAKIASRSLKPSLSSFQLLLLG